MLREHLFRTSAIALILFAVQFTPVIASPEVELSETEFSFGRVSQQVTIFHTFWIRSTGDDTLRIEKVDPGCGCTKAPLEKDVLAPGDSTRLSIQLSTRRYKGNVNKRPNIITNASEDRLFIQIYCEPQSDPKATMPLLIEPFKGIDVSQFTASPRRKAKFKITNKGSLDLKLNIIDIGSHEYDVEMPPMVKAGETVEGRVIVKKAALESSFESSFTFEAADAWQSRYTIPVTRIYRVKTGD